MDIELTMTIVATKNADYLVPCLTSIMKYAEVERYEIIAVLYRFEKEAAEMVRRSFPNVKLLESNSLRGYPENQNLALREAKGTYCLVLNDDTYFDDNSIRTMLDTFKQKPGAAIVSPVILNFDGTIQLFGRRPFGVWSWLATSLRLDDENDTRRRSPEEAEIFSTGEISGACFMCRKDTLEMLGNFDEYYFFTPDDIAISTHARKCGLSIYVNTKAHIYHKGSGTVKPIESVILPVGMQGVYYYFRKYHSFFKEWLVRVLSLFLFPLKAGYWFLRRKSERRTIMLRAHLSSARYAFRTVEPKALYEKLIAPRET